jgi:hypothetical protein
MGSGCFGVPDPDIQDHQIDPALSGRYPKAAAERKY